MSTIPPLQGAGQTNALTRGPQSLDGLPPGLSKRQQLPPGLAKRQTLPPGLTKKQKAAQPQQATPKPAIPQQSPVSLGQVQQIVQQANPLNTAFRTVGGSNLLAQQRGLFFDVTA